jgi:Tfp pilus assembly protein PilX
MKMEAEVRSYGPSYGMRGVRAHTRGFTLIASLLMMLLLSGIAIGLLMMANTEGKVGGTDLQNNLAFHAADGGIEKMASDLSATFQNAQSPTAAQICALGGSSYQPSMIGVTWTQYTVTPASGCTGTLTAQWGQISGGPNQGLWAQIIPINMLTTAALNGGQEVSMTRGAQVALIPVFQYGVFCEGDCGFFDSPNLAFAGRVHTNGDLYLGVAAGNTLVFNNKLEAYGNVVTEVLPNGLNSATYSDTGNVYIPTTVGGCNITNPATSSTCVLKATNGGSQYGDGSVTGAGSATPQTTSSYNTSNWNTFSKSGAPNGTNYMLVNGNYYVTPEPANVPQGTGAKRLSLPFVTGTTFPYQIIRRPLSTDSPALTQSREYNLAQIHILLSDDPADLPGGATDVNNVRLANIPANSAGTGYNLPYGITMTAGNYTTTLPSSSPNTYNQYFATASNAIPATGTCTSTYSGGTITASCPAGADWPYPPAPWTAAMQASVGAGTDPNCVLLCPTGAPYISNNGTTLAGGAGFPNAPALSGTGLSPVGLLPFTPCPTATMLKSGTAYAPLAAAIPTNCTTAGWAVSPYFPLVGTTSTSLAEITNADTNLTATWNLIDGWLRVEYEDSSGNWHAVTNEWLQLGFARGLAPPTLSGATAPANGTNPVNPNAILLLQQPADRATYNSNTYPTLAQLQNGTAETALSSTGITGVAPVCTTVASGKCTAWSSTPPQLLVDAATPTIWQVGSTTAAENSAPGSSTLQLQSLTRFNWYPINFYDAREGEPRDTQWYNQSGNNADNTCTANGIMNAVELDVGNLKRWLAGSIGSSGSSVNSTTQNGYVLYFSDRRGMLPNPVLYGSSFTKSGDSGLEDVINANGSGDGAAGTPDGALEPLPSGRTLSPEDVNQDAALDNFGADNLGLGFYGTTTTAALNMWYQITTGGTNMANGVNAANPDPFSTASYNSRIQYCANARKNWVSGARHVLKLVDGSLGNVPLSPSGTISDPGGFTVASENPVYIQGDYNTNAGDNFWPNGVQAGVPDEAGHAAAAVIADAVTVLSDSWVDAQSTLGQDNATNGSSSPTLAQGNRPASTTYYRVAIAGGKNMAFPFPSWENATDYGFGTDGGIHNFLRFLEDWNSTGATLNYGGSLVSLYYATYGTGVFKCCAYSVYQPPARNYIFDNDFTLPSGLPPGTPMFRDVETLSYRQLFTTRQTGQ